MPTAQTIMLLVPSVEVTKGDPHPFWLTFHPLVMVGGLVAVMRKVASCAAAGAKSNIRALVSPIGGCCLDDRSCVKLCNDATGARDAAEIIPIKQIRVAIFAHRDDKMDGVAPGTSTSNGPEPPRSMVAIVESMPIGRRPVIAGIAAKDRARLKTNHCFAAAPVPSSVESVTGGNERIGAVTGDAADAPYRAAVRSARGCAHAVTLAGLFIGTPTSQP